MILDNFLWTGASAWTSAGLGLGLVLLAYIAASTIKSWHRLRHIPGPPGAGFSKWWMLRNTLGGNMHLATKAACREYGKPRRTSESLRNCQDGIYLERERERRKKERGPGQHLTAQAV